MIEFTVSLGEMTMLKLNEDDEDEIYVLGGVEVYDSQRNRLENKTSYFASSGVTIFYEAEKGVTKPLDPQGDVYNEILDSGEYAKVQLFVVEHDAASTVEDVTGELRDFLDSDEIADIKDLPMLETGTKLARVLTRFIGTLGNIFDDDDVLRHWLSTYRVNSIEQIMTQKNKKIWVDKVSFSADQEDAKYEPVTLEVIARDVT